MLKVISILRNLVLNLKHLCVNGLPNSMKEKECNTKT